MRSLDNVGTREAERAVTATSISWFVKCNGIAYKMQIPLLHLANP